MSDSYSSKYKEAGVDIDKGNAFVQGIKKIVASSNVGVPACVATALTTTVVGYVHI